MSDDQLLAPWTACDPGDYTDYDGCSVVVLGDDGALRIAVVLGNDEDAVRRAKVIAIAPDLLAELHRQADTMADLGRALRLLGRPTLAEACEIAERSARAAIAKAAP